MKCSLAGQISFLQIFSCGDGEIKKCLSFEDGISRKKVSFMAGQVYVCKCFKWRSGEKIKWFSFKGRMSNIQKLFYRLGRFIFANLFMFH